MPPKMRPLIRLAARRTLPHPSLPRTSSTTTTASRQFSLKSTTPRRMPQDMPPEGGYGSVQYKRNLPAIGLKPSTVMLAMIAIMTYGFWRYKIGIDEWNELVREKIWGRMYLVPLLVAEEDRDQVRRMYAAKARERDLLGAEAKIYHSDRFVRPSVIAVPPRLDLDRPIEKREKKEK